jgi:UPF0716 protein FxsA
VLVFFVALAIVVGVIEVTVMIQVGQLIGFLNMVGLLLVVSLAGAWLVKRQGLGVMARIREQRMAGRLPAAEVFDGALILVAGVLLVIPGFVTDALGLLLLVPPVRAVARGFVSRRVLREVEMVRSKQWTRGARPPRQYVPPEPPRRPPSPPTPLPPASPPDR